MSNYGFLSNFAKLEDEDKEVLFYNGKMAPSV
jgi:hypothetical protein